MTTEKKCGMCVLWTLIEGAAGPGGIQCGECNAPIPEYAASVVEVGCAGWTYQNEGTVCPCYQPREDAK